MTYPASPVNDQVFERYGRSYIYSTTTGAWGSVDVVIPTVEGSVGVEVYAELASLPTTDNSEGDQAFVSENGSLYVWDGTQWSILNAPAFSGVGIDSPTGAATLPVGTTAQRPGAPAVGMIRYNTDLNHIEEYRSGIWQPVSDAFSAEGGTITTAGGYKYHTFTSSDNFTVLSGSKQVEYLVVAGGGGGAGHRGISGQSGGGGGAGGYRCSVVGESSGGGSSAEAQLTLLPSIYIVTIGAGGVGSVNFGSDGANSAFGLIASVGGGGGAAWDPSGNASSGGSGGGRGSGGGGTSPGFGSGTTGQGYRGGGNNLANGYNAGGGGGAAAQGQDGGSQGGGRGGSGLNSSITGSSVGRAGGGSGGWRSSSSQTSSIGFGGGAGGSSVGVAGSSGTTNTGGGGGGGSQASGGNGGSGIVIIRYAI